MSTVCVVSCNCNQQKKSIQILCYFCFFNFRAYPVVTVFPNLQKFRPNALLSKGQRKYIQSFDRKGL
jgi:hypothetical protein